MFHLLCAFSFLVSPIVQQHHLEQAHWGLSVRDVESGKELVDYNSEKLFVAASLTKLYTTSRALEELGPGFRFVTRVLYDGRNLVLKGGGDPSLSSGDLNLLAEQVKAAGIDEVQNITLDESGFYCSQYMEGAEWSDLCWDYAAAVSALNVNGNVVENMAVRDPASYTGSIFEKALETAGVTVNGRVQKGIGEGEEVARVESRPLNELVRHCNKQSDNLYAEVLAAAVDMGDLPVRGSGMSRRMLLSPDQLTKFLIGKRDCKELFDSLPVAGVDGSLAYRFSDSAYQGKIFAKTGSLSCVRTLAGYAYTKEGRLVAFAIMSCGLPFEGRPAIDAIVERVLDSF